MKLNGFMPKSEAGDPADTEKGSFPPQKKQVQHTTGTKFKQGDPLRMLMMVRG